MLLGVMPDESAAGGPLAPTGAKTRATDFSIAAIMARGAVAPPDGDHPELQGDGQFCCPQWANSFFYVSSII